MFTFNSFSLVFLLYEQVRWPNGTKSNYRFGYKDRYDLIMCDPRDPEVKASYKLQLGMYQKEKYTKSTK